MGSTFASNMLMVWNKLLKRKGEIGKKAGDKFAATECQNTESRSHDKPVSHTIVTKNSSMLSKSSSITITQPIQKVFTPNKLIAKQLQYSQQHCSHVRSRRLMKEYKDLLNRQQTHNSIFDVSLVDDSSISEWIVKLHTIDTDSRLYKEMHEKDISYIELRLSFPENYPFSPPFMYVASPRIENGYVLDGGAICMELLTPKGWACAYTIESLITQFAASLVAGGGRLVKTKKRKYKKQSAQHAFNMLVETHEKYGWVSPPKKLG